MKYAVPHDLDLPTARKAAEKSFASYAIRFAKYQPKANWPTDTHCDVSFTVKGLKLEGTIDLEPKAIDLDLDVPFLFRPFKSRALAKIEEEIEKWIQKAKDGLLDDPLDAVAEPDDGESE